MRKKQIERSASGVSRQLQRGIQRSATLPSEARDAAFRAAILSIPKGKVASYGQIAAAAGSPLHHRAVARLLRTSPSDRVPWHRVVGAGGQIKLRFEAAAEQRLRLRMEGVAFSGNRVNMAAHQHEFRM